LGSIFSIHIFNSLKIQNIFREHQKMHTKWIKIFLFISNKIQQKIDSLIIGTMLNCLFSQCYFIWYKNLVENCKPITIIHYVANNIHFFVEDEQDLGMTKDNFIILLGECSPQHLTSIEMETTITSYKNPSFTICKEQRIFF